MNIDELNARWKGKYVRTEDLSICCCGSSKPCPQGVDDDESHKPDVPFGGEGWVLRFRTEGDLTWVDVDWGYSWVITEKTVITERSAPYQLEEEP